MKATLSLICLILIPLYSYGGEYTVQKVKTLGTAKTKVIFQSRELKRIKGTSVLKGKLVAQWGTEVFEIVNGFYHCHKSGRCALTDFERVAVFRKCIVKEKRKVECRGKIGGGSASDSSTEIVADDRPDSREEVPNQRPQRGDEESEFPVRVEDEFTDIF